MLSISKPGNILAALTGGLPFGLEEVFGKEGFYKPDGNITGKEMILLYEKVSNLVKDNTQETIWQKANRLGLNKIITQSAVNSSVNRQHAAAIFVKLYAYRKKLDPEKQTPLIRWKIKDEKNISSKYYKNVLLSLEWGIFKLDSKNNFNPSLPLKIKDSLEAVKMMN